MREVFGIDNKMKDKPNLLIVGAAKAGTTSLSLYLSKHPDVFIPEKKELRFFIRDIVLNINPQDPLKEGILRQSMLDATEYFDLLNVDSKISGESSVHYLFHYKEAISNIKRHLSNPYIIIMLRDPIDRLISNYKFLYSKEHSPSLLEAIKNEEKLVNDLYNSFWYLKKLGFYYDAVKSYLDSFENVKVIMFEDFTKNPKKEVEDCLSWMGLEIQSSINYNMVYNKSVKSNSFYSFLQKIGVTKFASEILSRRIINNFSSIKYKFFIKNFDLQLTDELINELRNLYLSDVKKLNSNLSIPTHIWRNFN